MKANATTRDRRYRTGPDLAVSEVIAYIFMLALGAIALTVSVAIMSQTRSDGEEIGAGIQIKQVGEIAATNLQQAVRVASSAPGSHFNLTFELPAALAGQTYTGTIEAVPDCTDPGNTAGGTVEMATDDGKISTSVPLGKAAQVQVNGACLFDSEMTFHSSWQVVRIQYVPEPSPELTLEPDV